MDEAGGGVGGNRERDRLLAGRLCSKLGRMRRPNQSASER